MTNRLFWICHHILARVEKVNEAAGTVDYLTIVTGERGTCSISQVIENPLTQEE